MNGNEIKKTKKITEEIIVNLNIIYSEAVDARKQQQNDFEVICNKFNWLIVTNIAIIIGVISQKSFINIFDILSTIALITSIIISLISLRVKLFKRGPGLVILSSNYYKNPIKLLKANNDKIISAIEKNKDILKKYSKNLEIAIYLLISSIVLICMGIMVPISIGIYLAFRSYYG
jgi:hypothetical protein